MLVAWKDVLSETLGSIIRIDGGGGPNAVLRLIDRSYVKALSAEVRAVLASRPDGAMPVDDFAKAYHEAHSKKADMDQIARDLPELVEIGEKKPAGGGGDEEGGEINNNNNDSGDGQEEEASGKKPAGDKFVKLVPLQLCAARIENLIKV